MKTDPWHESVQNALREAPFAMRQLAEESGLSYDVLRSWRSGRRHPNRDSVRRLADGLAARAQRLSELSRELRSTVEPRAASSTEPRGNSGTDARAGSGTEPRAAGGDSRASGGGEPRGNTESPAA